MRRIELVVGMAIVALIGANTAAHCASAEPPYPTHPVRVVVSAGPGSGADIAARLFMPKLSEAWGQPVVIDDRSGASGNIAIDLVAKAPPDGYTLLVSLGGSISARALADYQVQRVADATANRLPYDPLREFAPISQLTGSPAVVLIVPNLGIKTVQELIRLAKAQPGKLNYASVGSGTLPHLVGELFKFRAGVNITHVPYKAIAQSMVGQLSGEVQVNFPSLASAAAHIKSGRLWALAVTSMQRTPMLPEVPTLNESGLPGFDVITWYGLLAPAGTPKYIVDKTQRELARAATMPEFRDALMAQGNDPVANTPEEFGKRIRAEIAQWRNLVKQAGLKVSD